MDLKTQSLIEWERWVTNNLIEKYNREDRETVLLRIAINMLDKVDGLEKDQRLQLMEDLQRELFQKRLLPF